MRSRECVTRALLELLSSLRKSSSANLQPKITHRPCDAVLVLVLAVVQGLHCDVERSWREVLNQTPEEAHEKHE